MAGLKSPGKKESKINRHYELAPPYNPIHNSGSDAISKSGFSYLFKVDVMTATTYVHQGGFRRSRRDRLIDRRYGGSWEMPDKSSKVPRRNPKDKRFSFPDQRSRHAATGGIALAVVLSIAMLVIVIVSSGINMRDADASGDIERVEETR